MKAYTRPLSSCFLHFAWFNRLILEGQDEVTWEVVDTKIDPNDGVHRCYLYRIETCSQNWPREQISSTEVAAVTASKPSQHSTTSLLHDSWHRVPLSSFPFPGFSLVKSVISSVGNGGLCHECHDQRGRGLLTAPMGFVGTKKEKSFRSSFVHWSNKAQMKPTNVKQIDSLLMRNK